MLYIEIKALRLASPDLPHSFFSIVLYRAPDVKTAWDFTGIDQESIFLDKRGCVFMRFEENTALHFLELKSGAGLKPKSIAH